MFNLSSQRKQKLMDEQFKNVIEFSVMCYDLH